MPRKRSRRCEHCGERGLTVAYKIDLAEPASDRNAIRLCDSCRGAAESGKLPASLLRRVANDREDTKTRELMGHAGYAREGHGAMRQIRHPRD